MRTRFETEVLPHLDAAYRFARWLCRAPADAEDIVHDAIVRAFRAYDPGRIAEPRAWLLAIVRNSHLSALRRHRAEVPLSDLDVDLDTVEADGQRPATPEQIAEQGDGERLFERLLAGLPEEYREVMALRELEELSYREIAALTGVPIGTVMSRLARARAELKLRWQREQQGAGHGLH